MKSRQRILIFLVLSICAYISFELLMQFNWRASSNIHELSDVQRLVSLTDAPTFKAPLRLIRPDNTQGVPLSGFEIITSEGSNGDERFMAIFDKCCMSRKGDCSVALKKVQNLDPNSFWFFHDTGCKNPVNEIREDNVGYASHGNPDFLSVWLNSWNSEHQFQGPFKSMYPIVYVRSLNVLTRHQPQPPISSNLTTLHAAVADIFEVVHESSTLYGGPETLRAISESLGAHDPHDQSRLINKEVLIWTGSSHISTFGTFSMPPIAHIATVEPPEEDTPKPLSGLYQVDHFGFIHIPSNNVSDDPIPEVTRLWLGRNTSDPISHVDTLSMKAFSRNQFLKNALNNLVKLDDILSEFSDLEFPKSTAAVVDSAINHIEIALSSNLSESLRHARIAAIESLEALNDHAVVDSPYFSIEYTFALYAPLALPISVPVLSALIRYIRERRNAVKKLE